MTEKEIKLKIKSLIIELLGEFKGYSYACYQYGATPISLPQSTKLTIRKEEFLLASNLGISFSAELNLKSLYVLSNLKDIIDNCYSAYLNKPEDKTDEEFIKSQIDHEWFTIATKYNKDPNKGKDDEKENSHSYWATYFKLSPEATNLFKYIFITSSARHKGNDLPLQSFKTSAIDYYIITQGIINKDDLEKASKNANKKIKDNANSFDGKRYDIGSVKPGDLETVKEIAYSSYVAFDYMLNMQRADGTLQINKSIINELIALEPDVKKHDEIRKTLTDLEKHILSTKFEKDEIDCLKDTIKNSKTGGGISVLEFIKHAILFKYSLSGNVFKYNNERCKNILTLFNTLSKTSNIKEASEEIKEWFSTKSIYDLNEYELEELDKIDSIFLFQSLGASQKLKYSKDKPISQIVMEEYASKKDFMKGQLHEGEDIKRIPLYYYLYPEETIQRQLAKIREMHKELYTISEEEFNEINSICTLMNGLKNDRDYRYTRTAADQQFIQDIQEGLINMFILDPQYNRPIDKNNRVDFLFNMSINKYILYKRYNFPNCIISLDSFWGINLTHDVSNPNFRFSEALIYILHRENIDVQDFFNSIMYEQFTFDIFSYNNIGMKELIDAMILVYKFLSSIPQESIQNNNSSFFQIIKYYNCLSLYIKGTDLYPFLYATDYKVNLLTRLIRQYVENDNEFNHIANYLIYLLYFDEEVLEQDIVNAFNAISIVSLSSEDKPVSREKILNAYNQTVQNRNIFLKNNMQRTA